ncbi:hypothetical protein [Pseudonocardia spinosispora]|uniref:hypothetical protein n=1 Tax=Pseudonocardia spinosispora TaxID=103441 RepID=UPI0004080010|nr:hypothetical protein [Pseudonocardia spinosispora]
MDSDLTRKAVLVGAVLAVAFVAFSCLLMVRPAGVSSFFGLVQTRAHHKGRSEDSESAEPSGASVSLPCSTLVTDESSLTEVLASAAPDAVICVRRKAGSAAGHVLEGADKILTGAPKQTKLHTTGYSFQDNQGGDNATISCGTIHKTAGGTGTYDNPITVAVPGHAGQGVETPCGTRIYVPRYEKYFLVEDTGATKYSDAHHIDIYVGGEGTSASASKKCMDPVTTEDGSPVAATINPPSGLKVMPGPITHGGKCVVGGSSSESN